MKRHPLRVFITGSPGSGKTTLATEMAGAWDLPHVDLDWVWFPKGAPELTFEERLEAAEKLSTGERWIADGAFLSWTGALIDAADLVVFLDVPYRTCARRMLWRHVRNEVRRQNEHPGWIRLARFIRYVRGYHDERHARPDQTTRVEVLARLAQRAAVVEHCRSNRELNELRTRLGLTEDGPP